MKKQPKIPEIGPLTRDWKIDEPILRAFAQHPVPAPQFHEHVERIHGYFRILVHETALGGAHPPRKGFARAIHDELYPLAHFARLRLAAADDITIRWQDGNQNYDAVIEDHSEESEQTSPRYFEVTTLQDREDAKLLNTLIEHKGYVETISDPQADHQNKVQLLRTALKQKGDTAYPENTTLLVYTDEQRFRTFHVGSAAPEIERRASFGAVVEELKDQLAQFDEVHVFSRDEIYCSLSNRSGR